MNNPSDLTHADEPIINIYGLVKTYDHGADEIQVLHDLSLKVFPSELVAVMGPSGSGKSTLLNILGLFLSPSGGRYEFEGRDVLNLNRPDQAEFRRHKVGFVFQSADLLENSTVYENLEYPLIYSQVKPKLRQAIISDALTQVNLTHRMKHPSNKLSGGEKQRVAVARAMVNNPRVILADEPTGALDKENTDFIMGQFHDIVKAAQTSMLIITHDQQVAELCTRTYILEHGTLVEA